MQEFVITGLGAVTSVGEDLPETWNALTGGESGAAEVTRFDPDEYGFRTSSACEVDVDPSEYDYIDERSMGGYARIGLIAAVEAVQDAGYGAEPEWADPGRVGVSFASSEGGLDVVEDAVRELMNDDLISPKYSIKFLSNLAAGHVSISLNAQGPNRSDSTACAAGTHAICTAVDEMRLGRADVMIVGGTDAATYPCTFAAFDAMRAFTRTDDPPEEAITPFDADRDGFLMGEGAGALVVETREHAEERGADVYAVVEGTGRSADAEHPTRPPEDARGLRAAVTDALDEAGRRPDEVDHVSAHGTATPAGDAHESLCLNTVFDDVPPVTSIKSMLGHTRGAAGAIEAVVGTLSIQEDVIPPTINYETPDPDCDVPVVDERMDAEVNTVLSNSAGFGGTNGSVVIGTYE